MAAVSDLRAIARQRAALIATARATSLGTFDRNAVALSQPIGDATMRHLRQVESRTVALVSHRDATNATDADNTCRTVASPIGSDSATLRDAALGVVDPAGPDGRMQRALLLKRPPSWAGPTDLPLRDSSCSCCGLGRWWSERDAPTGWRCWTCHPPDHLTPDEVTEFR
jgi:hypothetical protein